jgi:hypothetical protein
MKYNSIVCSSLLFTTAAPDAVKGVNAANQALESAKALKGGTANAPAAVQEQATQQLKAVAQQEIENAVPADVKQQAEALKSTTETANQLKGQLQNFSNPTGSATEAVKE